MLEKSEEGKLQDLSHHAERNLALLGIVMDTYEVCPDAVASGHIPGDLLTRLFLQAVQIFAYWLLFPWLQMKMQKCPTSSRMSWLHSTISTPKMKQLSSRSQAVQQHRLHLSTKTQCKYTLSML